MLSSVTITIISSAFLPVNSYKEESPTDRKRLRINDPQSFLCSIPHTRRGTQCSQDRRSNRDDDFDNKLRDASVNIRRQQKTIEAFQRLPEEFTVEDAMRCFSLANDVVARVKISRLVKDHLVEKAGEFIENGTTKAVFKKTGLAMG